MKINLFKFEEKLAFYFKVGNIKSDEDKELIAQMLGTLYEAQGRGISFSIEGVNELLRPFNKSTQLGFSARVNKQGLDIEMLMFTFDNENKINKTIKLVTED